MSTQGKGKGEAAAAAPLLQSAQDRVSIRVELLRLAHRHDQEPKHIVDRARALEAYVFGDQPADKQEF